MCYLPHCTSRAHTRCTPPLQLLSATPRRALRRASAQLIKTVKFTRKTYHYGRQSISTLTITLTLTLMYDLDFQFLAS